MYSGVEFRGVSSNLADCIDEHCGVVEGALGGTTVDIISPPVIGIDARDQKNHLAEGRGLGYQVDIETSSK